MKCLGAVILVAGLAHAADPAVWSSYLLTVAQSKDADAAVVRIATEYQAKSWALSSGPLVFEARLRAIEKDSTAWLEGELKALEARRSKMLEEELAALKAAIGEERFAALERQVAEWHRALMDAPRPQGAARKQ